MKLLFLSALISGLMTSAIALDAIAQQPIPEANSWASPTMRLTLPISASKVKFSGDGEQLLTTHETNQTAELWNLTTRKRQLTLPAKAGFAFCDVALSADGQFAAALLASSKTPRETSGIRTKREIELQVWNLKTGKPQWTSPIQDHILQVGQTASCDVEFSPDSQTLATSVSGHTFQIQPGVRLWSVPQGKLQFVTSAKVAAAGHLAFSRDSSMLGFSTIVDNQAQVQVWNLRDRKLQAILKAVEGKNPLGIFAVVFSPNHQDVIAYTTNGLLNNLYRWQVQTGKLKGVSALGLDRTDQFLGLSPDGETYVYGGSVTGYHIGNSRTNSSLDFPQSLHPTDATRSAVFSSDGRQMALNNLGMLIVLQAQSPASPPEAALTRQLAELTTLATAPDVNKAEVLKGLDRWFVNRVDPRANRNAGDDPPPPQMELLLKDTQLQPNQKAQFIKALDQASTQIERVQNPQLKIELLSSLPSYYQSLGASDRAATSLTRAIQLSLKQPDALVRATNLGKLLTTASQLQQTSKITPFLNSIEAAIVPLIRPGQIGNDPQLFQIVIPTTLAQAYVETQQLTKALKLLDRVAVLSPPSAGNPVLARLYLLIQRSDKANLYINALVKQPELLVEDSSHAQLAALLDKLKHPLAQQVVDKCWRFSNRSLFYSPEAFVSDYLRAGGNPSRIKK